MRDRSGFARGGKHWLALVAVGMTLLASCAQAPEVTPATPPIGTPVPAAERGQMPPRSIQEAMAAKGAEFVPLSTDELATVAVSAADAQAAALATAQGKPEAYSHIGFTYLGRWLPPPQTLGHAPMPDPIPAYVVQVLADPSPDFPDGDSAFVVVDAFAGEPLLVIGGCWGPDCRAEPQPQTAADAPSGCGAVTFHDYPGGSGEPSVQRAFEAWVEALRSQRSADAREDAARAALLEAAPMAALDPDRPGFVYVAREGDRIIATFEVTATGEGKYLVSRTWVSLPAEFCASPEGS